MCYEKFYKEIAASLNLVHYYVNMYLIIFIQQAYKAHKMQTGASVNYLDGTIEFLRMTSKIIDIFADHRPIADLGDHRLAMNNEVLEYLKKWESDASQRQELSKTERGKRLLSQKLRFDLTSMIVGFHEVCSIAFQRYPGSTISPFRTNSDLVENVFCQTRGKNGQNANPTYAQYGPTMNGIILGQTTTTSRSNTSSVANLSFYKLAALRPKSMRSVR